jgi:hypothetical protein
VSEFGEELKGIIKKYIELGKIDRLRRLSSDSELMSIHSSDGEDMDDELREVLDLTDSISEDSE